MAKPVENKLIRKPHIRMQITEQQLIEFSLCADPITGPEYFIRNFFYIQHPTKGRLQLNPFDYQEELLNNYHNHRFSINMLGRQMGKSTLAAGYLLWYAMFVPDSTILVASNKYTGAQDIMQRIRFGYENCPDHIRAGVVDYNKGSLGFDNGSRIVSSTTTETTGRGMSISLLYCDELAFVRPTIAKEFWTSISPTLSTGGKAIITSTPNSDEDQFADIWKEANKKFDSHGNETPLGRNGFSPFLATWDRHPERDKDWADREMSSVGVDRFRREHNCLVGDTNVKIKLASGEIKIMSIIELQDYLSQKDLLVEKLVKNNKDVEIWTDLGWSKFDGVLEKGIQSVLLIKFANGQSIQCTPEHEFYTEGLLKVQAKTLTNNHKIITDNHEITSIVSITEEASTAVYDIFNVEKNNRFYANDVLVSNCEFVIYDETLIAPGILVDLNGIDPIEKQGQVRWYEKPQRNHVYIIALDPSLGTGGDPAAIQVYDATTMRQVAEWQHNLTIIQKQVLIMAEICKYIKETTGNAGDIYYSIENNSIGEAALNAVADIGEENIPGSFLSEPGGGGRRFRKGFNTTPKSKIAACSKFKLWMETNKIKICSKSLISELKTFVAHGVSYAGKTGETDDLVMATLLAVRMILHLRMYDSRISDGLAMDSADIIPPMPFVML